MTAHPPCVRCGDEPRVEGSAFCRGCAIAITSGRAGRRAKTKADYQPFVDFLEQFRGCTIVMRMDPNGSEVTWCEESCYEPRQFGHKCIRPKHPKTEHHLCDCGHFWGGEAGE